LFVCFNIIQKILKRYQFCLHYVEGFNSISYQNFCRLWRKITSNTSHNPIPTVRWTLLYSSASERAVYSEKVQKLHQNRPINIHIRTMHPSNEQRVADQSTTNTHKKNIQTPFSHL